MTAPTGPEFDRYATGYDAGFDVPLKRALGDDARAFLRPKIALLRAQAARCRPAGPLRYLDFGCGTGDFLSLVHEAGLPWDCAGCDISGGMIAEAARRWPAMAQRCRLWVPDARNPIPEDSYDLISAVCVFHHIPPGQWVETLRTLRRALRPGGRLVLMEHNPWNPVTRWLVARAEIDRHAVLFSARRGRALLATAGFPQVETAYFMFFPPRWESLGAAERAMAWLPLGGQYLLAASAP
jgi:SAM-dependent methyltransferase